MHKHHSKSYYENLLRNSNIIAFLLTIRNGEGTLGSLGYYKHFGGGLLSTLSINPQMGITWTEGKKHRLTESNVGAYQFQNKKKGDAWPEIIRYFDFNNIEPLNQHIGALYLIDGKGAIPDILKGDIISAINKTHGKWASLPDSPYKNQPKKTWNEALSFYQKSGGHLYGHDIKAEYIIPIAQDYQKLIVNPQQFRSELADYVAQRKIYNYSLQAGNNLVPPITADDVRMDSKLLASAFLPLGGILSIGILAAGTIAASAMPEPTAAKIKQIHGDLQKRKTDIDQLYRSFPIDIPYLKKTLAPPELNNNDISSYIPALAAPAKIASTFDFTNYGVDNFKVNDIAGYYKKFEPTALSPKGPLAYPGKDGTEIPSIQAHVSKAAMAAGKNQVSRHDTISPEGKAVNINLNKPLIENFTISVKDAKEGTMDLKRKIEEVLLEILNSANAI